MTSNSAAMLKQVIRTVAGGDRPALTDRELLERFSRDRDQAAFATLVNRHSGLVLGVCRRALPTVQDAEDACQATFLLLAQKAKSIRWQPSVANWLYVTARQVAHNARVAALRRARREARAAVPEIVQPVDQMTGRELLAALDRELDRLPPRYREPLVLCYLEGLTRDETVARLGIPAATLHTRIDRGRRRLHEALTRSGWALGAGLLALAATSPAEASPPRLVEAILAAVSGSASTAVSALIRGVAVNSVWNRSIVAALILVGIVGLGLGSFWAAPPADQPAPAQNPDKPQAQNPKPDGDMGQVLTYAGRVVHGPEERPVAGAKVLMSGLKPGVVEFVPRATTDKDGNFRFTVRRNEFGDKGVVPPEWSPPERFVFLRIMAEGFAGRAETAGQTGDRANLTLRLLNEEIIKGRVVDLQGQPIAGVKVSAYTNEAFNRDRNRKPLPFHASEAPGEWTLGVGPNDRSEAVTDKEGRFNLRGIAKGEWCDLYFSGPSIVNGMAKLVARPQKPQTVRANGIYTLEKGDPQLVQYGSEFTHVAAPCKPILGTVREKGTGKPIAGARIGKVWIRDDEPTAWTETDPDGKFKLTGLPRGGHSLRFQPPPNTPYLEAEFRVDADQPGTEPVTKDIEIERQTSATGRITDAAGRPIRGRVEYRPLASNPHLKDNPLLARPRGQLDAPTAQLDADGRFTLAVLPGLGVLLLRDDGPFLPAELTKEERRAGVVDANDPELIDCRPRPAWPAEFHACKLIDVAEKKEVEVAIALHPGKQRPLILEFPDGKSRDVTVLGLAPVAVDKAKTIYAGGSGVVVALADGEKRQLFVVAQDGTMAAVATIEAAETGPVTLRLQPTGTVTGRLLDKNGKPLAETPLQVLCDEGPGRAGVFAWGGYAGRKRTEVELKRQRRTTGGPRDREGRGSRANGPTPRGASGCRD